MDNIINLLFMTSVFFILGLGCDAMRDSRPGTRSEHPKTESTAKPEREISDITWAEVDGIYNPKSKTTDDQKEELWKNYRGKTIEWEGEVAEIQKSSSSLYVLVRMNKDTSAHDLRILLDGSQNEKTGSVANGDRIKFRGTFVASWGQSTAINLYDGMIR